MLLAAAVRLPTLAQQSFWLDEGYTVRLMRLTLRSMLSTIPGTESTPPLYYVLAWAWTRVFGLTEYGLRSLSALAGIATVPLVYATARRLAGPRAGVIAGALLAVSPLMIWFSQEARAYALATLLAALTLLCAVCYLDEGRRGWLAGWALAAALGLATHYFVAFVVAPEAALLWWRSRADPGGASRADPGGPPRADPGATPRAVRRLAPAFGLVAAVAVALLPLALAQRGTGHADYIAHGALSTRVLQVPKQLLVGYASPQQALTAVLAAAALAAGALWSLARSAQARREASIPLIVGLAAVIAPVLLALVGVDFLNTRNLLPALPALAVAAAIGFAHVGGRVRFAALTGLLAAVSVAIVILVDANPRYQRPDWRGAGEALGLPRGPRAIDINPSSGLIPLEAYVPRLSRMVTPERVTEFDIVAVAAPGAGGGLSAPPRPSSPPAVPPGFRLFRAVYADGYTVLRYRSPAGARLTPAGVVGVTVGPGDYAATVQSSKPH